MGEAKRRKQLGINYGKSINESYIQRESQRESRRALDFIYHCASLPIENPQSIIFTNNDKGCLPEAIVIVSEQLTLLRTLENVEVVYMQVKGVPCIDGDPMSDCVKVWNRVCENP